MKTWTRRFGTMMALAAGAIVAAAAMPGTAEARGFVSFSFGVPLVGPPVYYYPPPPVYYYPPLPPAFAPPVAAVSPPAQPQACREYQATAIIDGKPQAVIGTACLQPDGTWRIVR